MAAFVNCSCLNSFNSICNRLILIQSIIFSQNTSIYLYKYVTILYVLSVLSLVLRTVDSVPRNVLLS